MSSPTSYEVLRWGELSAHDRATWAAWREQDRNLRSPFFDLGWLDVLQRCRGDVSVVRIARLGAALGFLPFHAGPYRIRPAGGPFSDWHGFVAAPEESFDVRRAVGAAGALFCFSAAPEGQTLLAEFAEQHAQSHIMDLSDGFAAYAAPPGRAAPRAVRSWRRSVRKLEQDGRELKFVYDDSSPEVLAQLIRLKSAQHRRTGSVDVMSYDWSRRLLSAVHATRSDGFSGLLSSLWIDGELAAAHFGMRSGEVLHYWQPVYRPEFAAYGPGMILMRELAREGAERGLREIDLGPGDYRHKHELANGVAPMIGGAVHAITAAGRLGAAVLGAKARWRRLPVGRFSTLPDRALRRADRVLARFAPAPSRAEPDEGWRVQQPGA